MATATPAPAGGNLAPPPELRLQWKKPFQEQLDFFSKKLNLPTKKWDEVRGAQHDRSFVVSGAMKAELLTDLRTAVHRSIAEGKTLDWFQKEFDNIVAKHGWQHTGDRRWRAMTIYKTNLLASYAAGREKQLADPELQKLRPYQTYRHSHTSRNPRRIHLSWDGTTVAPDDPWRMSHSAPCGWGCHCRWVAASRAQYREAQAAGRATAPNDGTYEHVDRWGEVHVLPKGVDYGWGHPQGRTWHPDIDRYPAPVARDLVKANLQDGVFERWHQHLEDKVSTELARPKVAAMTKAQQTAHVRALALGEAMPVAVLSESIKSAMGVQTQAVKVSDYDLLKQAISREGQAFDAARYFAVQPTLDEAQLIVRETEQMTIFVSDAAGQWYAAVLQQTASGRGVFLKSWRRSSQKDAKTQTAKKGATVLLNKLQGGE